MFCWPQHIPLDTRLHWNTAWKLTFLFCHPYIGSSVHLVNASCTNLVVIVDTIGLTHVFYYCCCCYYYYWYCLIFWRRMFSRCHLSDTVKHILLHHNFRLIGIWKFCCILISHFPSILLVFTRPLMGKLNFCQYLTAWFYPTGIKMHTKNMCFIVFM